MNYDITFCNRDCKNKQCKRNLKYINRTELNKTKQYISISDFKECKEIEEKRGEVIWQKKQENKNSRE